MYQRKEATGKDESYRMGTSLLSLLHFDRAVPDSCVESQVIIVCTATEHFDRVNRTLSMIEDTELDTCHFPWEKHYSMLSSPSFGADVGSELGSKWSCFDDECTP